MHVLKLKGIICLLNLFLNIATFKPTIIGLEGWLERGQAAEGGRRRLYQKKL